MHTYIENLVRGGKTLRLNPLEDRFMTYNGYLINLSKRFIKKIDNETRVRSDEGKYVNAVTTWYKLFIKDLDDIYVARMLDDKLPIYSEGNLEVVMRPGLVEMNGSSGLLFSVRRGLIYSYSEKNKRYMEHRPYQLKNTWVVKDSSDRLFLLKKLLVDHYYSGIDYKLFDYFSEGGLFKRSLRYKV